MFSRRLFLKMLAIIPGVAALWPAFSAHAKKAAFSLDKAEKLKTVGGSATLKIKDSEILFVRDAEDSVHAFDPTCSHEKCKVAYNAGKQHIDCPCHGSAFDLGGQPLNGPAKVALKTYKAEISGDRIIVEMD